jgi:hypothetical protein
MERLQLALKEMNQIQAKTMRSSSGAEMEKLRRERDAEFQGKKFSIVSKKREIRLDTKP